MYTQQEPATDVERLATEYCRSRDPSLRNQLIESQLYIARIVARKLPGAAWNTMIFFKWHPWRW